MADTITLKNGSVLRIEPFDQEGLRIMFEALANPTPEGQYIVAKRALPDMTDADYYCLAQYTEDYLAVLRKAGRFTTPVAPKTSRGVPWLM